MDSQSVLRTASVTTVLALFLFVSVAVAGFGLNFSEVSSVRYGEVEQKDTDLTTVGYDLSLDDSELDSVDIQIKNPTQDTVETTVTVSFLDGSNEVFETDTTSEISSDTTSEETLDITQPVSTSDYNTVNILLDGEEVIDATTITGTVESNPAIADATVKAIDDDEVIETTTTNSDGEYELALASEADPTDVLVVADGESTVNGNDFYAGSLRDADTESDVDFTFDETETATVDGEDITVSYTVDEESSTDRQVANVEQLQGVNETKDESYKLIRDIDAGDTESWNGGKGFEPIGDTDAEFTGSFDGQQYEITDLKIDRPDEERVGLFGRTDDATIEYVSVTDVDVSGDEYVGGLIGWNDDGDVRQSHSSGEIDGERRIGGLIGFNRGDITDSNSSADSTGENSVGGLAGTSTQLVQDSYATGEVTATQDEIGGLIGRNSGDVTRSNASGDLFGADITGGLVGENTNKITESYATGSVDADDRVGGLVGNNGGEILESYATGSVDADDRVGGLVGRNAEDVTDAYATGNVDGSALVGGLVGVTFGGEVSESYSAGEVDGNDEVGGLIGRIGRDNFFADTDHNLNDAYVDRNANGISDDHNEVIGEFVEGDGDGDIIIEHGDTTITDNGETEGDLSDKFRIPNDLEDEFGRTTAQIQDSDADENLAELDFEDTWTTADKYPILQWQD